MYLDFFQKDWDNFGDWKLTLKTLFLTVHVKVLFQIQVNLCQKFLFLHQLTHNMTTDCSLNYKFNTYMKISSLNLGRTCCVQKLFLTFRTIFCTQHVLQKEELQTNITCTLLTLRCSYKKSFKLNDLQSVFKHLFFKTQCDSHFRYIIVSDYPEVGARWSLTFKEKRNIITFIRLYVCRWGLLV